MSVPICFALFCTDFFDFLNARRPMWFLSSPRPMNWFHVWGHVPWSRIGLYPYSGMVIPPVMRLYIPSMLIPMIRNDKMNDHNPPSFDRGTYAYPFSHVQGRGSSLFHFFNSALYRRQNQEAEAQLTRFWTCLDCTWAFLLQFSTSHATSHMGR